MLTVFLSASVPSVERAARFRRTEHAAFEIEQAVVSLARAIFARNGRLVFRRAPNDLAAGHHGGRRIPRPAPRGERGRAPTALHVDLPVGGLPGGCAGGEVADVCARSGKDRLD